MYNTNIIHTRRLIQVVFTLNNTKTHEIFTARDLRVKTVRYWLAAGTHSHKHVHNIHHTGVYTTHINIIYRYIYARVCNVHIIYIIYKYLILFRLWHLIMIRPKAARAVPIYYNLLRVSVLVHVLLSQV